MISEHVGCAKNTPHSIEVYSAEFFDIFEPDPQLLMLKDIAHSLSNICRYNGHCKKNYNVAQHSVYVAQEARYLGANNETWLAALLHDGGEAYVGDVCRPIKRRIPEFKKCEDPLKQLIYECFIPGDGSLIDHDLIQKCDNAVCYTESRILMNRWREWAWGDTPLAHVDFYSLEDCWSHEASEQKFLLTYNEVLNALCS